MASFKMRFLQALILALLGSPALATVEPIVTLYGSLEGGSSQASTSQTGRTFLLVVAGNRDELDVTVEVRSGGDLFEGGATVTELRLANGSRVELPVQLTPAAKRDPDQGEALGTVEVRVRSGEDTIKVEFFYVDAKSAGQWELLAPGEYERIIDARVSALLRAAADRRALELAKAELALGNRPVVARTEKPAASEHESVAPVPGAASQQAWNSIAEPQPLLPGDPDPCNRYEPSGNYSYHVTGQLYFLDEYYSPAQTRSVSAGYPIAFDTQIRYANICGDVF